MHSHAATLFGDPVGAKAFRLPKGQEIVENPHASGYCCRTRVVP